MEFLGDPGFGNGSFRPLNHTAHVEFYYLDVMADILTIIVIPGLCVFGCIGNVINLIVLTKIKMRMRKVDGGKEGVTHLGLMLLALSDLFFCLSNCPRAIGRMPETMSLFETKGFMLYYQVYGTGFVTTFILTSTWITVAMAVLRYIGICHPLATRRVDSRVYGRLAYISVLLFSVLINIPAFWQYKILSLDMGNGTLNYLVDIGPMDERTTYGQSFLWVRVCYALFIPTVLLTFCNLSLVRTLRQSVKMRRAMRVQDSASKNSFRITLLLVVLVLMFILLVFPSEIMDFCTKNVRMNAAKTETFILIRGLCNVLQVINFAVNFVLYCIMNVHFRSTMSELFCCRNNCASHDRKHRYVMSRSGDNSSVGQTIVSNVRLHEKLTEANGSTSL